MGEKKKSKAPIIIVIIIICAECAARRDAHSLSRRKERVHPLRLSHIITSSSAAAASRAARAPQQRRRRVRLDGVFLGINFIIIFFHFYFSFCFFLFFCFCTRTLSFFFSIRPGVASLRGEVRSQTRLFQLFMWRLREDVSRICKFMSQRVMCNSTTFAFWRRG